MKSLGFQKYFLLLMLFSWIAQKSIAFTTTNNLSFSTKNTTLHATQHQSNSPVFIFDFEEEEINDDDSNESKYHLEFITPLIYNFSFVNFQFEIFIHQDNLGCLILPNQKINILNCTFLI